MHAHRRKSPRAAVNVGAAVPTAMLGGENVIPFAAGTAAPTFVLLFSAMLRRLPLLAVCATGFAYEAARWPASDKYFSDNTKAAPISNTRNTL